MNTRGIITLSKKEILRSFKVYNQTIVSPIINALLFFCIFKFALRGYSPSAQHVLPHGVIISTGLIVMSAIQTCYNCAQSSVTISKIIGFILDLMVTPMTITEIIISIVLGSLVRTLVVTALLYLIFYPFTNIHPTHPALALLFILLSSLIFGLLGFAIGVSAKGFDAAQAYTTYLITPLTMLSGTFYSVNNLPIMWQKVIKFNPVFYLIDGFRYSITGLSTSNWTLGASILSATFVASVFLSLSAGKARYHPIHM